MHFNSTDFDGAILATSDLKSFSVRRSHRHGEELATVYFSAHGKGPRHIKMALFNASEDLPVLIADRQPKRSPLGGWVLDFGQRSALPSARNTILVDPGNREIVTVRQVEKNALEIDAHPQLGELVVFGLGFASFTCRLP
jgi:hypothetical protein